MSTLFIRADSTVNIGTGHIMRCIALSQVWQEQGGKATFISRCESEALKERIQREGFGFITLDHICPDSTDLTNTLSIFNSESANQRNWLVLDGYHFTPEYQMSIRKEGILLMVIDDMNHLPHYHADILLNQNIHAPELKYCHDQDTTLLMGTKHVLLRKEFLKYRDFKRQIPDRAKKILVNLGGADPNNVTLKVIEAFKLLDEPDIVVRIIVGPANPHKEALHQALAPAHFEAELLTNPPNMPELMAWADTAVSAAGSTSWELAFMGVPSILLYLAENQVMIAESLETAGASINLEWKQDSTPERIAETLSRVILDRGLRTEMSKQRRKIVDGTGAERVSRYLLSHLV